MEHGEADARILLLLYEEIVRSHLDYGSDLMSTSDKKKPSRIRNSLELCVKSCYRCMKSTSINALRSECGEIRRQILAAKNMSGCSETVAILLDIDFLSWG